MTINNPQAFVESLWDWGVLKGCFGETRIEPTDIDGFVERNGRFLILETKGPGVPVTMGQEITFRKLKQTGLFTTFVIWGEPGNPIEMRIIARECDLEIEADIGVLREWVTKWFKWANGMNGQ